MRRLIVAAVLALCAGPVLAQGVGETVDIGGWKVRRVQGEGKTQTCVAVQAADDKTAVGFGGTNQMQGFLMLIDGGGKWKPGQEYSLEYKVDSGKTAKVKASATTSTTLVALLGTLNDVGPFFTAVESGNDIHLETDESTFDYPLKGSRAALAGLESCLKASMTN